MSDLASVSRRFLPVLPPVQWLLPAYLVVSLIAVLVLPELATHLPWGDDVVPNQTQLALTAAGIAASTIVVVYVFAAEHRYGWTWFGFASLFGVLLAAVKFVLSPASLHNTPDATLNEYVRVGLVVAVFYFLALGIVNWFARRQLAIGSWSMWQSAVLVVLVASLGVVARYVAVEVLDVSSVDYLRHVFAGAGWYLPIGLLLLVVTGLAFFHAATHDQQPQRAVRNSFRIGAWMIATQHAVWVVYMVELFS
jgi:hypothetical protein